MTKIGVLLTTVNHSQKQTYLQSVINSVNSLGIPFDKKVLSVDHVCDDEYRNDLISRNNDWEWSFVNYKNRVTTLIQELEKFQDCDFILHAEDDIELYKTPNVETLCNLFSHGCGILIPNLGGTEFDYDKGMGDLSLIRENTIYQDTEMLIFKRPIEKSNNWFVAFGTFFVKPDLFLRCLKHSKKYLYGNLAEAAFCLSWIYNKIHLDYYKATFCDPAILDNLDNIDKSILLSMEYQFVTVLDPMQGSNWYGGDMYVK
jgi:hypothetical protein